VRWWYCCAGGGVRGGVACVHGRVEVCSGQGGEEPPDGTDSGGNGLGTRVLYVTHNLVLFRVSAVSAREGSSAIAAPGRH